MKSKRAIQVSKINMELFSNSREILVWFITGFCYFPCTVKTNEQQSMINKTP